MDDSQSVNRVFTHLPKIDDEECRRRILDYLYPGWETDGSEIGYNSLRSAIERLIQYANFRHSFDTMRIRELEEEIDVFRAEREVVEDITKEQE